jgi:hypothetical protein
MTNTTLVVSLVVKSFGRSPSALPACVMQTESSTAEHVMMLSGFATSYRIAVSSRPICGRLKEHF